MNNFLDYLALSIIVLAACTIIVAVMVSLITVASMGSVGVFVALLVVTWAAFRLIIRGY